MSYDGPKLRPARKHISERLVDSGCNHLEKGQNIRGGTKIAAGVTAHLGRVTKDCGTFAGQAVASGVKKVATSPTTHAVVREGAKLAGQAVKEVAGGIRDAALKPVKAVAKNW